MKIYRKRTFVEGDYTLHMEDQRRQYLEFLISIDCDKKFPFTMIDYFQAFVYYLLAKNPDLGKELHQYYIDQGIKTISTWVTPKTDYTEDDLFNYLSDLNHAFGSSDART